jgi:protein-S-isoprenylcysteine O-methyltransferase Ste14
MLIDPFHVFAVIWLVWLASWIAAARWTNRTEKRAATWEARVYRLAILAGGIFLFYAERRRDASQLWPVSPAGAYALAAVTCAAVAFAWWARIHLGRLWSGAITRKLGHRVIDTGPYALVRHPIYAGLIIAVAATAAARPSAASCAGALLIAVGLWLKARAEERFLLAELAADQYGAYRRRVPMLLPFGRGRR